MLAEELNYKYSKGEFYKIPTSEHQEEESEEIAEDLRLKELEEVSRRGLKSKEEIEEEDLEDFYDDDESDEEEPPKKDKGKNVLDKLLKDFKKNASDNSADELELLHELSNLRWDFEQSKLDIDSKYAKNLGLSLEEFYKYTDINRLFNIKQVRASQTDAEKNFQKYKNTEEQPISAKKPSPAVRVQRIRKVTKDIINGKMDKVIIVTPPASSKLKRKRKKITLYSPDEVLEAWQSLQSDIVDEYNGFVQAVVEYVQGNKGLWEKEQKEQLDQVSNDLDPYVVEGIDKALNMLRGV